MLGKILLLVALPIGGLLAQNAPIRVLISSRNNAEFRVVRTTRDSVEAPLLARGALQMAADDGREAGGFRTLEIAASDTVNNVHVEATQGTRVIASGDGRYLTVRREQNGVAIEARSDVPTPVLRERKKP